MQTSHAPNQGVLPAGTVAGPVAFPAALTGAIIAMQGADRPVLAHRAAVARSGPGHLLRARAGLGHRDAAVASGPLGDEARAAQESARAGSIADLAMTLNAMLLRLADADPAAVVVELDRSLEWTWLNSRARWRRSSCRAADVHLCDGRHWVARLTAGAQSIGLSVAPRSTGNRWQ